MFNRPIIIILSTILVGFIFYTLVSRWSVASKDFSFGEYIPQLILLGGVLTLAVGGLLGKKFHFGEVLKSVGIWGGLFVLLIFGYAIRHDIANMANRTLGALVPGLTVINADRSISIVKSHDGHFYVSADVNANTIRFLVDTGASTVALTAEDATRIGFSPENLDYLLPISTANGMTFAAQIYIDRFKIGDFTLNNLEATVSRPGALHESLLGMNALQSLNSWRVEGDRLVLVP